MAEEKKRGSLRSAYNKPSEAKKAKPKEAETPREDKPEGGKEGPGESVHDRHAKHRGEVRKRHEKERREAHGQHRDRLREMDDRHEKEMSDVAKMQEQELMGQGGNLGAQVPGGTAPGAAPPAAEGAPPVAGA